MNHTAVPFSQNGYGCFDLPTNCSSFSPHMHVGNKGLNLDLANYSILEILELDRLIITLLNRGDVMICSHQDLINSARELPASKLAVAAACDREVLQGVKLAVDKQVAEPILVGDENLIRKLMREINLSEDRVEIIHEPDPILAAKIAVQLVRQGQAQVVMKGMVDSANFMRAVLDEANGLRTGRILSHFGAFEVPGWNRLIYMTDGGINIAPDLKQKIGMLENSVVAVRALGIAEPKVAVIAAVEVVNPKMQATLDAAELVRLNEEGSFPGVSVAGPYALDIAIDKAAAEHKRIGGAVAGKADILLMPNIETGNIFAKSLTYFAGATMAGIVMGPAAPVILTSRNDSPESKLASVALAMVVSHGMK
jgi:phosphate butyryltransferase